MIEYKSGEYTYRDIMPYFKDWVIARGSVDWCRSRGVRGLITYNRTSEFGVYFDYRDTSVVFYTGSSYYHCKTRENVCSFIIDDYFEMHLIKALTILEGVCGK